MPFTLIHLMPALIVNTFVKKINTLAIALGSILVDVEPAYKGALGIYPTHTVITHSLLGLITIAIPVVLITLFIEKKIYKHIYKRCEDFLVIYFSASLGVFLHILFDISMHDNIPIFYPIYIGIRTFIDPGITSISMFFVLVIFTIVVLFKREDLKEILGRYIKTRTIH